MKNKKEQPEQIDSYQIYAEMFDGNLETESLEPINTDEDAQNFFGKLHDTGKLGKFLKIGKN